MSKIIKYLDDRTDKSSDCWIWTGPKDKDGYGHATVNRKDYRAHRLAWMIAWGEIPDGKFVCHRCDVPACINPAHLFLGTCADNQQDMMKKGRATRGETSGMSKLTRQQVRAIRDDCRTQREIAEQYGIVQSTVNSIKCGRTWYWLDA